jgi:hypothetical protein
MLAGLEGTPSNGQQVQTFHWAASQGKGGGIGLLQQQRRVQATQGPLNQYQSRLLESNKSQKSDSILKQDDLLQLSLASSKQEHSSSYYVQMLKAT